MAGGAAASEELAEEMKADGYGKDVAACVDMAKELLGVSDHKPSASVAS